MGSIGFLHISDLHQGMEPLGWLWPNVREQLFLDLELLHKRSGPWDVVLFTGDLTQRGSAAEFESLEQTLDALFAHLTALGSHPVLLTVPGNHDLVRPKKSATLRAAQTWESDEKLRQSFWKGHHGNGRPKLVELVRTAFTPYQEWTARARARGTTAKLMNFRTGLLPGDFSTTLEKDGLRLGILGLNSAFLQLTGNDYAGHLDVDVRQFHAACGGDGAAWAAQHDACVVLTHHPLSWLSPRSRKSFLGEITIPGRFAAHLFGHMHEHALESLGQGGFEPRTSIQASSLFGLESFGTAQHRSHGYSAGRIEISSGGGTLHLWPRVAVESAAGHRIIVPDSRYALNDEQVALRFKAHRCSSKGTTVENGTSSDLTAAIAAYRQRLTDVCAQWRVAPSLAAVIGRSRRRIEVDFEQMYVPLRLRKCSAAEVQRAEHVIQFPGDPTTEDSLTALGPDEILAQSTSLVIRGRAGSGKSTWVEASFRQLLRNERALPIRISLRDLARRWLASEASGTERSLDHYIEGWLHEYVPELRAYSLKQVVSEADTVRPVLFLDGWDETGPLGDDIRAKLLGLLRRYPSVLAVVTSRPYGQGQPTHSNGFEVFELQHLDTKTRTEIARRYWMHVENDSEEQVHGKAEQVEEKFDRTPGLRELTDTPTSLLMALLLWRTEELPTSTWDLCSAYVEYLLNVQSDQRNVLSDSSEDEQWRPDDPEERMRAVCALAFASDPWEQAPDLETAANRLPIGWPAVLQTGYSRTRMRRAFICWLAGPAALLVERTDGRFDFVHRSIQEFLAAYYLGSVDCSVEDRLTSFERRYNGPDNWPFLRKATKMGCSREPAWLDPIVNRLATMDDHTVGLLGSLFAEGVGRDEDFREWSTRFVYVLERRCNESISACIVEWHRQPDDGRRSELLSLLQERALASTCQAYRRLNVAHLAWSGKHLAPPSQGTAVHLLSWFNSGECSNPSAVAVSRVLSGGSALWPGKPAELALLNLWPSYRRVVGQRLQLAAFCGADRKDLIRCAADWLIPPKWDEAASRLAAHSAQDWQRWLSFSVGILKLHNQDPMSKKTVTAEDLPNPLAYPGKKPVPVVPSPWVLHLAQRWSLASARDLHRLCLFEQQDDQGTNTNRYEDLHKTSALLGLPAAVKALAQHWSAVGIEQWAGFWAVDWLVYLEHLQEPDPEGHANINLAAMRAGVLGKLWLINWARYWGIVESRFIPIRRMSWDSLAIPLAESWADALIEVLQLSPECAWINDFVWLDLMSIGRDTARAVLAKEQPGDALWALLAEASRLSIGATIDPSQFKLLLGSTALPDEPLWPALARYLAGCASMADHALLDELARHPDRRTGPLSWGLQHIVRGDILLNDGNTVTLDELAAEAKQPSLPYIDPANLPRIGE